MAVTTLSAGVVVLYWHRDHYRYLLLRAYNYWDFPKGQVESGEAPLDAAIREVQEETGLVGLNFDWGEPFCETQPYNHGRKVARYYIARSVGNRVYLPVNPELGRPEHNGFLWATRREAWKLVTPRVQQILRWSDDILFRQNDKSTPGEAVPRTDQALGAPGSR